MAKEIELKLGLPAGQARRVTMHPLLAGYKPQRYRLFNTYYDTPEFDLRNRRIALRLRRKGSSTWLMTVKGGASGAGGLAQRTANTLHTLAGLARYRGHFYNWYNTQSLQPPEWDPNASGITVRGQRPEADPPEDDMVPSRLVETSHGPLR